MRVVAVADTDSYVKWAAALLGTAPADWDVALHVLDTPVSVSDAQLRAAVAGSGLPAEAVRRVSFDEFERMPSVAAADVLLLAARGPLVRVLARSAARWPDRPVIVSGLPGISIPATRKALIFRTQADLFVVHSHREVREFAQIAERGGFDTEVGLATLPFAAHARSEGELHAHGAGGDDLVFAAQAKVPSERDDRARVARLLVEAAHADRTRRVVVKLRGARGEHQTHAEADPFPELLAEIDDVPPNLVTSTAPMAEALDTAAGLVTISSTAAIEALARGIPVIALDAFGVSEKLINPVFEGSGLFGSAADVVARRFGHPSSDWVHDNYLHDRADDDWVARVEALVAVRRAGALAPRPTRPRRGGRLRDAWERKLVLGRMDRTPSGALALVIGTPLRAAVRAGRRLRRGTSRTVSKAR